MSRKTRFGIFLEGFLLIHLADKAGEEFAENHLNLFTAG
jgi:hypothetical protein